MNPASSRKTLGAAALAFCTVTAALSAQGVPLPPISDPAPGLRPAAFAAPPPREPVETLPAPRGREEEGGASKLRPPPQDGAATPGAPIGRPGGPSVLFLEQVLASVDRHYPLIRAAELERDVAAGRALSARGAFDTRLTSDEYFVDGTYDSQRYSAAISQPVPGLGAAAFARYRLGAGDYPVYYGERKTAEGGEFSGGVLFPLLRNRAIDPARANVARADIDRALAEPGVQLTRLDSARAASRAFWSWVAAGQRLLIAEDVLRIARRRDEQLGKRVRAGTLPRIEQEDNRRAIFDREARVVQARRAFQAASIALSLYYRDEAGCPLIPSAAWVPGLSEPPGPPHPEQRQRELEEAVARRPELERLRLQREKALVDLKLAQNQALPGLNVGVVGKQDVGFGRRSPQSTSRLDRSSVELAVNFDLPIQRRDALGKMLSAQGELGRITAQEQFARDRVQAEVQDAANAVDNAYDLLRRGKANRLQAAYLEEAERRLFDVGKSDLFRVNIRELTAAEARLLELEAAVEFYRAWAEYQAALGIDPSHIR